MPAGPVVQQTGEEPAAAWTFQDLLRSRSDADRFEHYLTAEIVRVGLDGEQRRLGGPGDVLERRALSGRRLPAGGEPAPALLVPRPGPPLPRPGGGLRTSPGRRSASSPTCPWRRTCLRCGAPCAPAGGRVGWRSDAPATLAWAEAQDGGDRARRRPVRDRVYLLAAPFDGAPAELIALDLRYGGVRWGDGALALVEEWWWQKPPPAHLAPRPGRAAAGAAAALRPLLRGPLRRPRGAAVPPDRRGARVLLTSPDGGSLYLSGAGASPDGDLPFLDRLDLEDGTTERLWRCAAPSYEFAVDLIDPREGCCSPGANRPPSRPTTSSAGCRRTSACRRVPVTAFPTHARAGRVQGGAAALHP